MNLQDLHAALLVGPVHQYLAVEPTGPQQRGVENFRPVGGRQNDEPRARIEAVELDQELIERLLLFVMASGIGTDAASPAERVEFVDKDDGGRLLVGLLEQVAHARSTYADEHFDEFRARDRKERHLRFTGDGLGQQRLAGAGRTHQQHAFRHAATEPAVVCWAFQEVHDFSQFVLGLVDAGDVFECDTGVGFDINLGLAFADRHQPATEPC